MKTGLCVLVALTSALAMGTTTWSEAASDPVTAVCTSGTETQLLLLSPDQLLARLATLVPPPRTHAVRYHGVFAPNATARARVVPLSLGPAPPAAPSPADPSAASPPAVGHPPRKRPRPTRTYRVPWADLLEKVFAVDVLSSSCGGRLRLIAFIADATVAKRILDHLHLDSRGPHLARAQAPPDLLDPGPSYDGADVPFGPAPIQWTV